MQGDMTLRVAAHRGKPAYQHTASFTTVHASVATGHPAESCSLSLFSSPLSTSSTQPQVAGGVAPPG